MVNEVKHDSPARLRPGELQDALFIKDLYRQSVLVGAVGFYDDLQRSTWAEMFSVEKWPGRLQRYLTRIAEVDGEAVGFCMIDLENSHIFTCYVHPQWMNKGIGRQMMAFLESAARDKGLQSLTLDGSLNAQSFYEKLGFGTLKVEVVSINGVDIAVARMVKRLDASPEAVMASSL